MRNTITISITREVHEQLKKLGLKDDTFDQIIARLLDFYNQHKEVEKEDE